MTLPSLPAQGSTSWFPWAAGVHDKVAAGAGSVHDVKDYGAVGNGSTDDTSAIQAAISAASTAGGGVVHFPAGTYIADGITMRHHVTLRGAGMKTTHLKAKAGGTATGLILLNQGYAQQAFIEDMELLGNGNVGQHGVHMVATGIAPFNNGGWWQSGMRRVEIRDFDGHSIFLKGGGGVGYTFLTPHQFLVLEQVYAFAKTGYNALRTEGQVGQVEYIGCEFDGPGVNLSDNAPNVLLQDGSYLHAFRGCVFQTRKYAVVVDAAGPVVLDECYWESTGFAVTSQSLNGHVSVRGGNYSNAAAAGDGSGRIFRTLSFGVMHVSGALHINGTVEGGVASPGGRLDATLASQEADTFSYSDGTKQLSVDGSGNFYVAPLTNTYLVNTSATQIINITGPPRMTGQVVYLRAQGGSIVFASGGNIDLAGRTSPFTVASGRVVTLVKFDLGANWTITSVST